MSLPRSLLLCVLGIAFATQADSGSPGHEGSAEAQIEERGREVAHSLLAMRAREKGNRNQLQDLAHALRDAQAALSDFVSQPSGNESTDRLAVRVSRLKTLADELSRKAATDARISSIEPELRSRLDKLIGQLDALLAEPDPGRRRVLAIETIRELGERDGPRRPPGPTTSLRLERRQLDVSALDKLRSPE